MKNLNQNTILLIYPQAVPNVDYYVIVRSQGADPELVWQSTVLPRPTDDQLLAAIATEQERAAATAYIAQRTLAYPPMQDYIDAQVKKSSSDPIVHQAGIDQEATYLAACLKIKEQFPKL